jgi:hypothetical protein
MVYKNKIQTYKEMCKLFAVQEEHFDQLTYYALIPESRCNKSVKSKGFRWERGKKNLENIPPPPFENYQNCANNLRFFSAAQIALTFPPLIGIGD